MSPSPAPEPPVGLRERKKARTRAAIQQHALRLFKANGYEATTVEQIAAAAEISPSTFFRYFPTKEAVVQFDVFDDMIADAVRAQPPELRPVAAIRAAMHAVFDNLPEDEMALERERQDLIVSVPDLRAATIEQLASGLRLLQELVAERVGRSPDDLAVRTFAGAIIGVVISTMLSVEHPSAGYFERFDEAFALLEAGLPL